MTTQELEVQVNEAKAIYQESGLASAFRREFNGEFIQQVDFGVMSFYLECLNQGAFVNMSHSIGDMETVMKGIAYHDAGKLLIPPEYMVGYLPPDRVLEVFGSHCSDSIAIFDMLGLLGKSISYDSASLTLYHHPTGPFLGNDCQHYRSILPNPASSPRALKNQSILIASDVLHAAATRVDKDCNFKSHADFLAMLGRVKHNFTHLFKLPFEEMDLDILANQACDLQKKSKLF